MTETQRYYWERDLAALKMYDFKESARDVSGWSDVYPTPEERRLKNQLAACTELPRERRTTTQTGIEDSATYDRCWYGPSASMGQRMGSRPEPQTAH